MSARVFLCAAALAACSAPGTNTNCTDIAVAGLTVDVFDQVSGASICDATVTATDGSYSETLQVTPGAGSSCSYAGAYERAGTYDVTVVAPGHATNTQSGIVVPQGVCHVAGQTLDFEM